MGDALPTLYVRVGGEIVTVEGHIVRSEGPADGDPSSPQRLALSLTADDEARRALQAYVFRRFRESEQHLEEDPFDGSR